MIFKSETLKIEENLVFPKLGLVFEKNNEIPLIADYYLPVGYLLALPPPEVEIKSMKLKIKNCNVKDDSARKTIESWKEKAISEWKLELKNEFFDSAETNQRRSRRSVIAGIALTIAFLVGIFAMRHYNTNEQNHLRERIHTSELQVDEHSHIFKRLLSENQSNFDKINNMFCNLYQTQNEMYLKLFLDEKKQYTQTLLLTASENKLPITSETRLDLFTMCVQLQKQRNLALPNHQALCHRWAAHTNSAEFKGAIIDHHDTIKVKYEIQVPIFTKDVLSFSAFNVINLGFFAQNKKFKLSLPSKIAHISNSQIINIGSCNHSVCLLSDFYYSKCASSLILNKSTENCEREKIPSICSYHFHAKSYLVSLNGTFITDQKTITTQSNFMAKNGIAICHSGHATELIPKPDLSYETNLKSIFIGAQFNDSNLSYSQNLTDEILSLKNITQTEKFDSVQILILINITLLSIIICSVIAFAASKISQCSKTGDVIQTEPKAKSVSFEKPILKPRPKSIAC